MAATGARGQGFGLSTGGGPGTGSTARRRRLLLPRLLITMTERIRSNWNQKQDATGTDSCQVSRFSATAVDRRRSRAIERLRRSLDLAAQRALAVTRQSLPLPPAYPNATLTVHLNFQYNNDSDTPFPCLSPLPRRCGAVRTCLVSLSRAGAAAAAGAASAAATEPDQTTISGEGGAAPRLAVPDFIAVHEGRRDGRDREDHRPGAVRRPELRARVLRFIPRDVYENDSRRHVVHGRRRSTAGAN